MGYKVGLPCIKLNSAGVKTKKCGDLSKVSSEALSERNGLDQDINHSSTEQNEYLSDIHSARELVDYSGQHCAELRDRAGRKLRSDAVRMIATVIKPPGEFMDNLTAEEQKKFLHDATDCLGEIIGKNRIKAAVIHYDELVPHVHIFWEPVSEDGFLCAKEVFNLSMLTRINKEMPAMLREHGWKQIDDCQMYDALEQKEKITKLIEKYQKDHPEEIITSSRRNELFKQFKEEITKERRRKNGKSSYEFKKEQDKALSHDISDKEKQLAETASTLVKKEKEIEERTEEIRELKKEKTMLSADEEQTLFRKITKAVSAGKESVQVNAGIAEKMKQSLLAYAELSKKERLLREREKSLTYREDEFQQRVEEELKRRYPLEIDNLKKELSEKNSEIQKLKEEVHFFKEREISILKKAREVLKQVFDFIFHGNLPEQFTIFGKDYGKQKNQDASTNIINDIVTTINNQALYEEKSHHIRK